MNSYSNACSRDDRRSGFDVAEASNADEVVAVLEVRLDIAVVFTDIQMPASLDGLKLASGKKPAAADR
jgi:CheY-like chemotaxis protein